MPLMKELEHCRSQSDMIVWEEIASQDQSELGRSQMLELVVHDDDDDDVVAVEQCHEGTASV